jgi:exopolyphosphatase/guanosine-5'-triphosphate,3'-diphosphate pyrophosphatase
MRYSFPLGAVRCSHLFDTTTARGIGELKKYCFETFRKTKLIDEAEAVKNWVVVGGTVTSMAAVLQQLEVYDAEKVQGYVMDQSKVTDLLDRLCHMSYDEKCNLPGMRPERADIIVAGVAILDSLMEYFAVSEVKVSDRDLSEGLLNADTMMPKD